LDKFNDWILELRCLRDWVMQTFHHEIQETQLIKFQNNSISTRIIDIEEVF